MKADAKEAESKDAEGKEGEKPKEKEPDFEVLHNPTRVIKPQVI